MNEFLSNLLGFGSDDHHSSLTHYLEKSIYTITLLLPGNSAIYFICTHLSLGRFTDAEIVSESLSSILNILKSLPFTLLSDKTELSKCFTLASLSPDQKYLLSLCKTSSLGTSICIKLLFIIRQFQTVLELVLLKKYGEDNRINYLVLLESVKLILKISLWTANGYKMHLNQTSDVVFSLKNLLQIAKKDIYCVNGKKYYHTLASIKKDLKVNEINEHVLIEFILKHTESLKDDSFSVSSLGKDKIFEFLYMIRPLLYGNV